MLSLSIEVLFCINLTIFSVKASNTVLLDLFQCIVHLWSCKCSLIILFFTIIFEYLNRFLHFNYILQIRNVHSMFSGALELRKGAATPGVLRWGEY